MTPDQALDFLRRVAFRSQPGDPIRARYEEISKRFRAAQSEVERESIAREIERMIDRAEI